MDITFYLRDSKAQKKTAICLNFNYKGYRLRCSTGLSISPKLWDKKKAYPKHQSEFYADYDTFLKMLKQQVLVFYHANVAEGKTPTPEQIEQHLLKNTQERERKAVTFTEFVENYITKIQHQKAPATISVWNTTLKYLQEFAEFSRQTLTFEAITLDFYYGFVDFLYTQKKAADNTVGKYIRGLKVFMSEATEQGINSNMAYKSKKFKAISEETDSIYLSEPELEQLHQMDLSGNTRLAKVRDLFLIGCYTALRVSDFKRLDLSHIHKDRTINIRTQKTGEYVIIPLHPVVEEVLSRNGDNLPKAISGQKFNVYIKELCQLAGFKSLIIKNTSKGGEKQENIKEKWQMVSSHTCRRSGATNMFLAGIPTLQIMKITGHKKETSFLKYIRIDKQQNAELLRKHQFFAKKGLVNVN
jgi:integrase